MQTLNIKTQVMKYSSLILFTTAIISSCGGGEEEKKDESKENTTKVELVGIESLSKKDFQAFFEIQGTTEAAKEVLLNSETPGLIRKIYVEEGQKVRQGQTLMVLDAEMVAKSIDELEKSLELAEFVFEKQKNLHDQNIGSELQFQQAKNNKERLEESLKTLKAQQGKSVVTAPFSGHIDEIFMHEGEMAMPQAPLIRLLDISGITITADVMESYLQDIKPSTKVDIRISSLDTLIEGATLSRIGKFVNSTNRSFIIESKLVNKGERILPNLVANVRVNHSVMKDVYVIPSSALLQSSSGQNYIYITEPKYKMIEGKKMIEIQNDQQIFIAKKIIVERLANNRETQESVICDMPGENKLSVGLPLIVDGARGVKNGMEVGIKK
jgi:membrane fusion protein (multidrug efflux system)